MEFHSAFQWHKWQYSTVYNIHGMFVVSLYAELKKKRILFA